MVEYRSSKEREEEYDRLAEVPLPCSMEELRKLYDIPPPSAATTSDAESPKPASSRQGDSVVSPTIPETSPGSDRSLQNRTVNDEPEQLEGVGERSGLHETSGHPQPGSGVGERFDKHESDDEGGKGDEYDPPWLQHETSPPLSLYNAAHFCREYYDRLHGDSTSYSQTGGTERPDKTKAGN
jgi:hypothetical protein